MSRRLHLLLASDQHLRHVEPARSYFYQADGTPKAVGTRLHNPDYAHVLKLIAAQGAEAFYRGKLVQDMVQAVRQHPTHPGDLSAADFAAYEAKTASASAEHLSWIHRVWYATAECWRHRRPANPRHPGAL